MTTDFDNLVLNESPGAVLITTPDGIVAYWSGRAQSVFGFSIDEAIGRSLNDIIVPPDRAEEEQKILAETIRDGSSTYESIRRRKDGSLIHVIISSTAIRNPQGQVEFIISSKTDVTKLRGINEGERIKQDPYEKNIELQNAAAAKNRFLANMSHELRTPLNGIIGFSEFLADGKPGPINAKQKEYLQDILSSGRHLLQLINDILDLAKVDAGKIQLSPSTFSLRKAIEQVAAVAEPIAQKRNIHVSNDIAGCMGDVTLDPQKFKQVLYNLLSNAIKFTDDGGSVEIRATPLDERRFKLSVKDTGIGIRAEDFGRLFIEFAQLESGESRRYEGTGLGLALTRRIVELQGGTIAVESEVGKGSVFTVTLPMIAEEPDDE